jgi:glutamate-1-semialdehyde 2,1-aminomutase
MVVRKKIIAIIQARSNSSRFPNKVLKKINGKTLLEILIKRLSFSKYISKIVVATTKSNDDKKIIKICKKLNVDYFSGYEKNVLKRYYFSAKKFQATDIVRITGDCPLIDHRVVDLVISKYISSEVDYASNINPPTFPDGMDVEIFPFKILKKINEMKLQASDKEHVTSVLRKDKKFKKINIRNHNDYSKIRLCIDYEEDLDLISIIFKYFKKNINFSLNQILSYMKKKPEILKINDKFNRNEGQILSEGQKLWIRAKNIIPGGTMLFSKNPDLFLPKFWPSYFSRTKGINIWDLEGKKYVDMSYMGVGTNILGYSNKQVDDAVRQIILNGNMSTLNSKEEVLLAEKLVDLHPWSEQARFTRTGGEACSVAIRLARASTNNAKIAVCGYHGWHDWYLAANLDNTNNLNHHLMKNLNIGGVPKFMKNSCFSFNYNDIQSFLKIVNKNKLAAVIMEVSRLQKPQKKFLLKIKKICNEKGIVLIFDECTSGFRENLGGLHLKLNVNPDVCILGKALGNGYAINAIIGTRGVMNSLNSTFISSTFWTERIGSAAALKTIDLMEKNKSWKQISETGKKIKKTWLKLAKRNDIKLQVKGLDPLPKFEFASYNQIKKTFITQEFLKKKILANDTIYLSTLHVNKNIQEKYFNLLDNIFRIISQNNNEKKLLKLLDGPVSLSGLRSKNND